MFRPLVLRRNFSLFNRVPHAHIVRSAARQGYDSVTIQRVRIRRPFFSNSRLVGAVAVAAATYGLVRYLGLEVEIEEIDDDNQSANPEQDGWEAVGPAAEDGKEEDDGEGAILFLPTGFSRPRQRTFYKGSDPEWQDFKKIAIDRAKANKIGSELVAIIRYNASNSPQYIARLGKIDVTKGKTWVEFRFPPGPPVEYERPGIELTKHLEWRKATRPVEDAHHQRLSRILYPKEVADALYNDTTKKAGKVWKNFKVYMGWEQEPKTETVQDLFHRISTNQQSSAGQATSIAPSPLSASANDTQQPAASPSTAPVDGPANVGFVLPDPKKMTLDLAQFRADFRKAFKPYTLQPPRGTFVVIGLIEIYGERARMTLNVQAVYDPKQGRYLRLTGLVWNYVEHQQYPRGGS
ncbi:uncharacterized protein SETTUDRAFT_176358 [Exserohilum turcica Et28A]|uniref:Uncharacterized protein n=1 Tax=Exserohilum turcicum (strain 28A) TaxID=671987 RepID=R0K7K4_EXST2|nr:uncharacterized protein SETTUDRAFT_176358 [Exserohilum turcica Et28A]EOA88963.1 hypothetical protein SETTUDRAFT_176358 [Exserohilum turcica Et28A]